MNKERLTRRQRLERALGEMVIWDIDQPRQKLQDFIDSRHIVKYMIGRRCIGAKESRKGDQRIVVYKYKPVRFVLCFEDGLRYNVDKIVFNHYRAKRKVEYFNWYE